MIKDYKTIKLPDKFLGRLNPYLLLIKNNLFIVGGFTKEDNIANSIIIYLTLENKWIEEIVPPFVQIGIGGCCIYDESLNRIVLLGGSVGNLSSGKREFNRTIYTFSFNNGKWEEINKLPYGIDSCASIYDTTNGIIYCWGGFKKNDNDKVQFSNELLKYDILNNNIYKISDIKNNITPRAGAAGFFNTIRNKITLIGGFFHGDSPIAYNQIYEIDPDNLYITEIKQRNKVKGRSFLKSEFDDDKNCIITFGGTFNGYDPIPDIYLFYYNKLKWKKLSINNFIARQGVSMTYDKVSKIIYLFGGGKYLPESRKYLLYNDLFIINIKEYLQK